MSWYKAAQVGCLLAMRILYRFRMSGVENIPEEEGFVVASNHVSYYDPVLLGTACLPRRLRFMAKEELFVIPLFGRLIRFLGAVPVRRGGMTRGSFREFRALLRDGKSALLMFPEGTRSRDGQLGSAHRGVGALCIAAGVTVVPAYIAGAWEVWPRTRTLPRPFGRIEVRFGRPVEWTEGELGASEDPSGELANIILKRIRELSMEEGSPLGFWRAIRTILGKGRRTNRTDDNHHNAVPSRGGNRDGSA